MVQPAPFKIVPPEDTPEYMYGAYFSCLHWAIGFEPALQSFTQDTGIPIPTNRSPIEQMVDKACGRDPGEEFIRAFVPWFNTAVWGKMDGEDANE